jgi:single-strand DNA-binding protein
MATLNQVMFIGRLGKDPTSLQVTKEGKPFIRFSLAVDQSPSQEAMWLNVTAWEKQAEAVEKYARKGTLVFVQGRLQLKKYKDKTTQVERLSVEINATNVQLLEKRQKEGDVLPDEVLPEA